MRRFTITLLLLISISCLAAAQEAASTEPEGDQSPEYRLGPGDSLQITVIGLQNLSLKKVTVSNSGKIHLPFLGILPVADLTPIELEGLVVERLKKQKLVKEPQVQVLVTEFRAQPVYILGEIGMPGQYVLRDKAYLMDLLTWSGGVNDVARDYGFLYRRNPKHRAPEPGQPSSSEPLYKVIKVDLKPLLAGESDIKLDLVLQGGDLFHVPKQEKQFFFVVGDVARTGSFSIPEGETLLATRALATAGGPARTAKLSKGVLVRMDEVGQRQEIPLDFGAIFKGKKPDFPVKANDIIFIPGSHFKTIAMGMLGILPYVAERTAYQQIGTGAY
ncbi:MAG: hypothetical protein EHM23_05465 [Acidobacteria bacterium]|nr:MAG: hypothetical protein EHM23_05465 [Acidobacteriota bacterium]